MNKDIEGIVTSVDVRREVCKVLCMDGRTLTNVSWRSPFGGLGRSGLNYTPVPRERVTVSIRSGDYVIVGSRRPQVFSRTDLHQISPLSYVEQQAFYNRYNTGMVSSSAQAGNSKALDQIPGDVSITQGGGSFTVTNTGSILAKASSFAQILLTKIDDVVRVVGRNYQQFSEASKKVQESVLGRVYQYHAWYHTRGSSVAQKPEYEEIIGDVAAGESKKGDYSAEPNLPSADDRVYKRIISKSEITRFTETSTVDGETTSISTDGGDNVTTENMENDRWRVSVVDSTNSSIQEYFSDRVSISSVGSGSVSIVFNADGTCTLQGSTRCIVDFPEVVVNAPTTTVNATTATINTDTSNVTATTSATITAPTATVTSTTSLTVNSPLSMFSGLVTAASIAIGPSGAPVITGSASGLNMIGTNISLDSSSDIDFGTTSLKTHVHLGDGAASPPANTSVPIGA